MRANRLLLTAGLSLGLCVGQGYAFWPWNKSKKHDDAVMVEPHCPPAEVAKPEEPKKEEAMAPEVAQPPVTDAFAQAPAAGTEAPATFNPQMLGDAVSPGAAGTSTVFIASALVSGLDAGSPFGPVPARGAGVGIVQVPNVSRGAFKVSENESPRPVSRAFVFYNYYNGVKILPVTTVGDLSFAAGIPSTAVFQGTAVAESFDIHRQVIGFENAFLGGRASIGLRVPFFQSLGSDVSFFAPNIVSQTPGVTVTSGAVLSQATILDESQLGDITVVSKYALYDDPGTGNLLSTGLLVTIPTHNSIAAQDAWLLQPWVGGILNFANSYLHGFSALIVPSQGPEATIWANDIGYGWWLYRGNPAGGLIQAAVPTVELHINSPLSRRDDLLNPQHDLLVVTAGMHVGLGQNTLFTFGMATPITGPRLFDAEGFAQLNFRY